MSIHPYLFFSGTCGEAFARYHEILGGELEVMTFGDLPEGEEPPPFEVDPSMVMHAAITLGDDLIMASDDPSGDGGGVKGVAINLTLDDEAEARRVFEALAEGGEVQMPLGETFWSPCFGTCVDRFGVSWMVNTEGPDAGS